MTEEQEDAYVFAQDLTRLRIAADVLKEFIHEDFYVKDCVIKLNKLIDKAYKKTEAL